MLKEYLLKSRKIIMVFIVLLVFGSFSFFRPNITGFFVGTEQYETQNLNLIVAEDQEYDLTLEKTCPEDSYLEFISMSGSVTGTSGNAKVYLRDENGNDYLILEKGIKLEKDMPTGFAVLPEEETTTTEPEETTTAPPETTLPEETTTIPEETTTTTVETTTTTINETTTTLPEETTTTSTTILENQTTTTTTILEEITNTTTVETTTTIPEETTTTSTTTTIPEIEPITIDFSNECEETCNLAKKNLTANSYILIFELEDITLDIDTIEYSWNFLDQEIKPKIIKDFSIYC